MSIIFILIPISLILFLIAIFIFFWSVKREQYDNLDYPAEHLIYQDAEIERQREEQQSSE